MPAILPRMKILLTGSNGQLGTDCRRILPAAGHEVLAYDLPALDIRDEDAIRDIIRSYQPDAIVNAAAYTAVDRAEGEGRSTCWQVNQEGTANLAKLAAEKHIYLIHISTDYVFSGDRPRPEVYVETDSADPRTEYGKSKLAGEEEIRKSGAEHAILRTAWLYGAIGHNFLKVILRRARALPGKEMRIVNDQWGSPTCSHSLARQIQTVLAARPHGLFHASNEGACTWHDFAKMFFQQMKMDVPLVPCTTEDYPTPAPRPHNSVLENAALKKLNLNRMPDWQQDLTEYITIHYDHLMQETNPT